MLIKSIITLFIISILSSVSYALPVTFTYTGEIVLRDAALSDLVSEGDSVVLSVTVDNGGSDLFSQMWAIEDTVSAVFSVGDYVANITENWFVSSLTTGFVTNETGALILSNWFGTTRYGENNTDNFGSRAHLRNGSIQAANGWNMYYSPRHSDLSGWSVPVQVGKVPLPASAWLFASGLVLLYRRRKHAQNMAGKQLT